MSAGNFLNTRGKAFGLRTKEVLQENYTVRVGGIAYGFIVDRVVKVTTTTDGDDITITVPNGSYYGQRLLVILIDVGHDETVSVTPDTGDSVDLGDDGDFVSLEYVDSTTGWQTIHTQNDAS